MFQRLLTIFCGVRFVGVQESCLFGTEEISKLWGFMENVGEKVALCGEKHHKSGKKEMKMLKI